MPAVSRQSRTLTRIVTCFLVFSGFVGNAGAHQEAGEYEVKAAFLYNFSKFVEWPAHAFPDEESPFIIGILGSDPFGRNLDLLVKDKSVKGRRVEVRRLYELSGLSCCQVLFIAQSEAYRLPAIIQAIERHPILTVSDMAKFLGQGGIIMFTKEGDKIRFSINLKAASKAMVTISSKLLNLASRVEE